MFKWLREYLGERRARQEIRSLFSKHISRKLVEELKKTAWKAEPSTAERAIEFVYIAALSPDEALLSEVFETAFRLASEHGGAVHAILPVLVIGFGVVGDAPAGGRTRFVAAVQNRLTNAVAIVHGSARARVGTFGSKERIAFGFWWPGSPAALQRLAALSAGEVCEIS